MPGTITALVSCQNIDCAAEVTYPLDHVRKFNSQPLCEDCYEEGDYAERDDEGIFITLWDDLPTITLEDLCL